MKTYTTSTSATGLAGTLVQVPTRRYLRGRLGGLKDMPDMPLDILIEVRVPVFCTYATARVSVTLDPEVTLSAVHIVRARYR